MDNEIIGVLLYTDDGIRFMKSEVCSNGIKWTAKTSFKYCNGDSDELLQEAQANNLKRVTKRLSNTIVKDKNWYNNEYNFRDVTKKELIELYESFVSIGV